MWYFLLLLGLALCSALRCPLCELMGVTWVTLSCRGISVRCLTTQTFLLIFSRFLVPISSVICNDITAYLFGFFFGRTPLIKVMEDVRQKPFPQTYRPQSISTIAALALFPNAAACHRGGREFPLLSCVQLGPPWGPDSIFLCL